MIKSFMHVKLDVTDMSRSERFYKDYFGLVELVRHRLEKGIIIQLALPGQTAGIELWYEEPVRAIPETNMHIAFSVEDTRALLEKLREKGVTVAEEPFEIGDEVIAFVSDPDGYLIELNQALH